MPSDEARERIADRSLLDCLERSYRGEPHWLDLSTYSHPERDIILRDVRVGKR